MTPEFWSTLLSSGNVMIAAILAEGFVILYLGKYIKELVEKLVTISTKTSEILEKVSTDYRTKKE